MLVITFSTVNTSDLNPENVTQNINDYIPLNSVRVLGPSAVLAIFPFPV